MNRLADEKSPYLLQHAGNPVEWYPWCDEVFERARQESKPILLSIGYSSCHWCHVMARESFENDATAAFMNENFLNIKVDREEHPDIDSLYMAAVQEMTGQGGWPLTVFLNPEGAPFYGGTYFPPEDGFGLPSFQTVLDEVARMCRENSGHVEEVTAKIKGYLSGAQPSATPIDNLTVSDSAYEGIRQFYDRTNGGFGRGGPKFPYAMALEFLLMYGTRTGKKDAVTMVEENLTRMAWGGIYDQVGGGFHRYSVDPRWEVPHFEKMLYDNALLIRLYTHTWQVTGNQLFRRVACETADYVLREMTSPEGGFYSSQDADSSGTEGLFYIWSAGEVTEILGTEDSTLFNRYYSLDGIGKMDGGSPLIVRTEVEAFAEQEGLSAEKLESILEAGRKKLYEAREKRQRPARDDKVITAWNGLMVTALAEAAGAFNRGDYLHGATRATRFLIEELKDRNGRVLRYYKEEQSSVSAYLEDYALLASGCLTLYTQTLEQGWLEESYTLGQAIVELFFDKESGLFYDRGADQKQLLVRQRCAIDNDIPSGNAATADLLLRLFHMTGEERLEELALGIIRTLGPVKEQPLSLGHLLCTIELSLSGPFEVAIIEGEDAGLTEEVQTLLKSTYLPNLTVAKSGNKRARFVTGKDGFGSKTTVHICYDRSCHPPATGIEPIKKMISERYGRRH
ncbi:MAG: thioredoxin domain-containing protein [Deltaproteobacteria bacterium]|nr:thioredoxin domain-containing protein [Deltaproteobacteria bacterium]